MMSHPAKKRTSTPPDRIEKEILLEAPRARVWRALTDPAEFGAWFGVKLSGRFVPGEHISGPITSPGYEHVTWDAIVERMEPERLFSYRWHPYAIEPGVDYSGEERTLVEFTLEERGAGTFLRLVESGFDKVPPARRLKAWEMNDGGWAEQMRRIARHLGQETP
jgi:uncharacterized protein YndB with AHSA1/START domain